MKKSIGVLLILIVVVVVLLVIIRKKGPVKEVSEKVPLELGIDGIEDGVPEWESSAVYRKKAFILGYDEEREQPAWVCYILTGEMVKSAGLERKDRFFADPAIITGSAVHSDYTHSGFDRGHLVPAKDMAWSEESLTESFYLSNISPQTPAFNRGIWKELESEVREWALSEDSLIIITGPVFGDSTKAIGRNRVSVPVAFYKIVVDISYPEYKSAGFLMSNTDLNGNIWDYAVSIDSIEKVSGLDFFSPVKSVMIDILESLNPDPGLWQTGNR